MEQTHSEVIAILSQDASTTRCLLNTTRAASRVHAVRAKRRGRKAVLLVASSTLLLPLISFAQFNAAQASPREKNEARNAKTRVPAAALAALARANRLMTPTMEQANEDNVPAIEISLQHALELAPQWLEAHRTFARWKTVRHQWDAAALGWQAVLELAPRNREAKSELTHARQQAESITAPSYSLNTQSLVNYGHDLSGGFNDEWWNAPMWNPRALIETRVSAKIERLGIQPLPPFSLKVKTDVPSAIAPDKAPISVTEASSAKAEAVIKGSEPKPGGSEAAPVPVVAGVTTIEVPDEDAIPLGGADTNSAPVAELPVAPADVPTAARASLARARQLTALIESLPEAEKWALTELQRAVELAPQWVEAQHEMALWHEEHGDWEAAAQSWEKIAVLTPNDATVRLALQNALRMAQVQTMWANRSLVTLGHDSANPIGHEDPLSTRVFAAPLAESSFAQPNSDAETPDSTSIAPLLARVALDEAVRVEAHANLLPEIAENSGESKVLLAQATAEAPSTSVVPVAPATPEAQSAPVAPAPAAPVTPTAPVSTEAPVPPVGDTLIPVAPAPVVPSSPDAAPVVTPSATGDASAPTTTDATASTSNPPTITNGSDVNVQTVLPGAASLPKPVVKAPPTAKKPVETAKKPVKKNAKKPAKKAPSRVAARTISRKVSRKQAAAAWPWVNLAGRSMGAKNFPAALSYYQKAYSIDPTNSYALFGVPNAQMILKRYPEAIVGFKRFLAAYPNHPKGVRALADSYTFSGQFEEAAALNGQILARNPKDFTAALQAAQVLAWSKKYEESGRFYRMALAVKPDNGSVWTEYAETLSYAKDQRAREAFNRALQLNPQSQRAKLGLANWLSWNSDYTNAAPLFYDVLKSDPNNLKARLALADALTFSSRAALAIPEYETVLKLAPESPEARLGLGRALTIAKRYDEAIALLSPLAKEQPTNADALNMLGVAQISNQPGAALATFENLLKLQDRPDARAATLSNIGDLRVKLNQPDEARTAYDEAVKLAPQDNKIALSYARALMRGEQYADAEPLVAAVLQRDPANQSGLLLQATLAARMGQNERAAALTEQLQTMPIEVSDDALNLFYALRGSGNIEAGNRLLAQLAEGANATPDNLIKVANSVRDTGQEEASYALYQRVLQADPENVEAHVELAEAYMRRKEFEAAQKEVDAVLMRQPGNVPAKVMGATLALRRDRNDASFDNATIVAKEALEKEPNNIPAHLLIAEVASTRSNFAQAAENYRAVLEQQPNNLPARLGLARNLYYLKQVDESIKEYQLLIQQAPDDATIKLELAQVYLDRNRLDEAQRLFVDVLKAGNYPLPPSVAQLARRVPGAGDIVSDATQQALKEFAAQEKKPQSNKNGG